VEQRLRELLGGKQREIPAGLQGLYQALTAVERPATVASWLDRSTAPAVLRDLRAAKRPLTHQALDELPAGKPVEHLRSVLVATGTLPRRDEQMARLQRWITCVIVGRPAAGERELVHRYAIWHLLRRLRRRTGSTETTYTQTVGIRRHIRAAITLLDWFTARGLTLATARQGDLDAWITSGQPPAAAKPGTLSAGPASAAPATSACPKPLSNTTSPPSRSTSSGSTPGGPGHHSTGPGPATSSDSSTSSPPEMNKPTGSGPGNKS
jgi:hypothetical protein